MQMFTESPAPGLLDGTATFSPCERYRYTLTRGWAFGPVVVFLMLNPSTATAELNDPTITRCIGYAKRWGFGGLVVLNLFAFRATDPDDMKAAADPVGPENDAAILRETEGRTVVCAWGAHGTFQGRGGKVCRMLEGRDLRALAWTKDGEPRHPLYLKSDLAPVPFPSLKQTI